MSEEPGIWRKPAHNLQYTAGNEANKPNTVRNVTRYRFIFSIFAFLFRHSGFPTAALTTVFIDRSPLTS